MYDEEPWKMALVQYCAVVDRLWLWLDRLCTFGTSWLSLMSWQRMEHMESGAEPVGEKSQRDILTDCSVKQISLWEAGASTKLILLKNIKVTLWSSIDQHGVKDGNPSLSILNQRVPQFTKSRLDLLSTWVISWLCSEGHREQTDQREGHSSNKVGALFILACPKWLQRDYILRVLPSSCKVKA